MRRVRVGTSGWSYPVGRGHAGTGSSIPIPPGRRSRAEEASTSSTFYAEHFDTVEINSTFYRVPAAADGDGMGRADAGGFRVLAEAVSEVHAPGDVREGDGQRPAISPTRMSTSSAPAIDPLASGREAGALLAQFPGQLQERPTITRLPGMAAATLSGLSGGARAPPSQLERRAGRHASSARRIRRGAGPDRRAEIQASPSARICSRTCGRSTTCACTAATRRSGGTTSNPKTATTTSIPRRSSSRSPKRREQASRDVKKAYLYANNHFSAKSVANAAILKHDLGQPLAGEYPPEFVDRYPDLKGLVRILPPPPSRKPS